jgi:hypothetical protein
MKKKKQNPKSTVDLKEGGKIGEKVRFIKVLKRAHKKKHK